MKNRLIELLKDDSINLGSGVLPDQAAKNLIFYLAEWKKWNAKINLTAENSELPIVNKHIYESLQYTRAISPFGLLADIGSGAGFPGIPIKVALPKLDVVLVESQRKRANFLKTVIRSIGLGTTQCVHGRVEDFPEFLGKCDFVTLRHVLEPRLSLQLGAGLLNASGSLLLQTSFDHTFHSSFLGSVYLSLADEIFITHSTSSHSKIMVFKRSSG